MIFGIDPGNTGALACYRAEGWDVYDCPTLDIGVKGRRRIVSDPAGMARTIDSVRLEGEPCQAFIEQVHAMPKQGVSSTFKLGTNYGIWLGILAALKIPVTEVTPQRWKKEMLAGTPKGKDSARLRATQMFPYLADDLKRKKDHGRADALLIGEWGRRQMFRSETVLC